PNHDFIAHAVSKDGLDWERVNNAIFIGDPGSWDDLMLWTMAVSPDPWVSGRWRMFYTGLSRQEQGRVQRIGLAESDDLYHWRKAAVNWPRPSHPAGLAPNQNSPIDPASSFPLEAEEPHYEASLEEGRHWTSFRDPYYWHHEGQGSLLAAGRVPYGPVVRRGCVSQFQETSRGIFVSRPPLHHPGLYDDVEVPNLLEMEGHFYLIGSIREDAKIRYWHTADLSQPWKSFHDNVLMAQGNYAGRVCRDDRGWLLWNFFTQDVSDRTSQNVMPPPKRLTRSEDGLLRVTTFEAFETLIGDRIDARCLHPLKNGALDDTSFCSADGDRFELRSEAGFRAFVFEEMLECFRFRAHLQVVGKGKCGLVLRVNPETHDGYYLSLDMLKGVAQLRSWETGMAGSGEEMMQFRSLQSGFWHQTTPGEADIQLIAMGSYLEFSINGNVILSLADHTFVEGLTGLYLETAHLVLDQASLYRVHSVEQSEDYLVTG
ncbi:MAG: glycosyl hydrolase, partial [Verrucomicrobiota bacterium]